MLNFEPSTRVDKTNHGKKPGKTQILYFILDYFIFLLDIIVNNNDCRKV